VVVALAALVGSTVVLAEPPTPQQRGEPPTRRQRARALVRLIVDGAGLSRTVARGAATCRFTPATTPEDRVQQLARRNLRRAARYVVGHAATLPLSRGTACRLNRVLTRDLVADAVRGDVSYRRDPAAFYRWLASPEAGRLGRSDPVALAERLHHAISALDSFPDGSGRTARLMADLALIKAGRAPACHTGIREYFERGNPRSGAPRAEQQRYFQQAADRGQQRLDELLRR
jgi:hypothetical protein